MEGAGRGLGGCLHDERAVCGNARIGRAAPGGWGSEARRPGRTRTWLPHCPSWTVTTEPGIARAPAQAAALEFQARAVRLSAKTKTPVKMN